MAAQQQRLDAVANDLANAKTLIEFNAQQAAALKDGASTVQASLMDFLR